VKKLIFIIILLFLTIIIGKGVREKLTVPPLEVESKISMPEIPVEIKKMTDTQVYEKKIKEETEFDRLNPEEKRQYDYNFIQELFLVTRKVEAGDEDVVNWLNVLEQEGSREGIYQALVLDEIYTGLEEMNEVSSERLINFLVKFGNKFLNKNFSPESLKKLNPFSLKRIFTDHLLDLMEYYEVKDLDSLYRWYALYSEQLAQDYGPLMKTQIRSKTSGNDHYQWAIKMPLQHIKSEVIIKTHLVMNGLQLLN
jgi:hypothetical protein